MFKLIHRKKQIAALSVVLAVLMIAVAGLGACGKAAPAATTPAAATSAAAETTAATEAATTAETTVAAETTAAEAPIEKITITAFQYALDNQTTDFQNLWFYQQLEAQTGVHVDFTIAKESEYREKVNLMFVSGDYADVLIRPTIDLDFEEYGVTQGIVIPLDDGIRDYMPNYSALLKYNNVTDTMLASDGKMYYLGNLIAQNINHEANWFINKTWLNAVGKDVPATIDELTGVLEAFRDQKPGGGDNTFPMSAGGGIYHQTNGIYTYFSMFGVPMHYYVYACIDDNDKIVFPGHMDGFREACEWLSMCYNNNLLDKDALVQSDDDKNAKVNADEVGFITYLRLINTAWTNPDTIENWTSILPPSTARGAKAPRVLEIPVFGAALTIANKHVPETLKWLDAQFDTETMMVAANGPIKEGGPLEPCMKINDDGKYEVLYIPEDNGLYTCVPVTQGQFFAPGDFYFNIYELPPHRIERMEYSKEYEAAGVVEKNSYMILANLVKMNGDDNTERERLYKDIDQFMREKISTFIMKGVTDASWGQFLGEADNLGVNRYIELYQAAYDKYLEAHR